MKEVKQKTDIGVIVARFQTAILHDAHKDLIQTVLCNHDRVMVFLGIGPIKNTLKNPLDFKSRKAMIEESFPDVEVYYVDDNRSDSVWSANLDKQIRKWANPGQTVTLYGSRDSFLKHYSGGFNTCELESEIFISASEMRKKIINNYTPSADFRAGLIAATGLRYPTAFQTVDVAVFDEKDNILLVKKPGEVQYRFIGGFSDPSSSSLEEDAKRETMEETGVEIDDVQYIGSTVIDDWRYRGGPDKIKTALFKAKYIFGTPEGADDVESAKWFSFDNLTESDIVEEHHKLLQMLKSKKQ